MMQQVMRYLCGLYGIKTSAENPEKLDFILSRKCYDWSYNKYNTSTDY